MLARSDRGVRTEVVVIGGLALAKLTLYLATNRLYDFHRDSLCCVDSARHPAWGYADYPPVASGVPDRPSRGSLGARGPRRSVPQG